MVKGVSKTVIVVNNTGNKFFEKVVFYVTPEYGNLSHGQLNSAASKFLGTLDFNSHPKNSLRKRYRKRKRNRLLGLGICTLAILGVIIAIIL